jgi:hypothetical protein
MTIVNKQSQRTDKRWFLSMQVGQGASNIAPQNIIMLQNVTQGLGLGWYQNVIWDIKYQESL